MQSTPSKAQVHQQGEKKKSNYWFFLCGMIGCGGCLVVGLVVLGTLPFAIRSYVGRASTIVRADDQRTKTLAALDSVRQALTRHDSENKPLLGTSLDKLRNRYIENIPMDAWGNDILVDTSVGILISYGADAIAGGKGCDEDVYYRYKPALRIERVQYTGPWGYPHDDARFIITLSKPFKLVDEAELLANLQLLRNMRDYADGRPVSFAELNNKYGHKWGLFGSKSDMEICGTLVLRNSVKLQSKSQTVTPTMALNFTCAPGTSVEKAKTNLVLFGLKERWLALGPLDPLIYGTETKKYLAPPEPKPLYHNRNRGVKIERY